MKWKFSSTAFNKHLSTIFKSNKNINILGQTRLKIFHFQNASFRSSPINVDRFNFKGKICKKKTRKLFFLFFSRIFMQKSQHAASHLVFKAKNKPSIAQYYSISRQMCPFTFRICHCENAAIFLAGLSHRKKVFRQIRLQN